MTTSQWVNTEPDAGALYALLLRLSASIPATSIDELWIFPTRRIAIGESTVIVVAGFEASESARRRVITARYAVTRDRRGTATVQEKLDEHGTAPEGAVARIVHGVLRRLGEEGEQPPRTETLGGDEERWWALIEELGGYRPAAPDPAAATEANRDAEPIAEPAGAAPEVTEVHAVEPEAAEPHAATPEAPGAVSGASAAVRAEPREPLR
jgi:hypothetical protein